MLKPCCYFSYIRVLPEKAEMAVSNSLVIALAFKIILCQVTIAKSQQSTTTPWSADYASSLPEPPVCGYTNTTFNAAFGSIIARIGDYPWIARIAYNDTSEQGFSFRCEGSLITSQHILTAARCIADQLYFVRLGEFDTAIEDETIPVDVLVKYKIKHENYSAADGSNDIGILVFDRKVTFTESIGPVCLPTSSALVAMSSDMDSAYIVGWGQVSGPPLYQNPTILQMTQVQVYTPDTCNTAYSGIQVLPQDGFICAGNLAEDSSCGRQSGGPLVEPIRNSTTDITIFYQIGVVSFGMQCNLVAAPAIYTQVADYMPWIKKIVLGTDSASS